MTPRNLTIFRFPPTLDLTDLDAGLREYQLKPVGALELQSRGFVSPFGRDSDVLSHQVGNAIWITVGTESKILPASVVADKVAKKLAEIEQNEGRKLGGRARKRVKEDLIHELLPQAFVKPGRIDVVILTDLGIIAVDASSRKAADAVVSDIRHAMGSFPALPLNAELAPRGVLTGWVIGAPMPDGMALGDKAELRDPADRGAVVKLTGQELQGDEVKPHLEAGKQVTRLQVAIGDHVSVTLGDDLILRGIKLLDGAYEALDGDERDSWQAELDARFALFAGELRALFGLLEPAFRLSRVEG